MTGYKRPGVYFVLFALLGCGFPGFNDFLAGQDEMDRTDPVMVANYVLKLVLVGDVDGLLDMMPPAQKETYTPFTPERREQMQNQVTKDREKIEKVMEISEIREMDNISGKPAVVARIAKKADEVYVIVLTREENIYYYGSFLTLGADAYKALKLIKKAK
jgi:hypothetical protein